MKRIFFASILTLFALESLAEAKEHSYTACDKLGGDSAAKCTVAAKAKCSTLDGYWPKQHCGEEVALSFDVCVVGGTYKAACETHKTAYYDLCMSSTEFDMNKPATIPEFKRRALAIDSFVTKAEGFVKDWGTCFPNAQEVPKCGGSQGDVGQCKRAATDYQKSFKSSVDFYLDKIHPQKLAHMDTYAGKGDFAVVGSMVQDSIKSLALLQKLTKELPAYGHRATERQATMKQLVAIGKIAQTNAEKIIAATRCPKGKGNKKRVLKTLRPSVNQFFASGSPQAVKTFSLRNGKKVVTKNAARRETTESYAGHACTEGVSAKTSKPLCQVFSISVKRSKIAGQPWGSWTTFVGASEAMLCKNLK